MPLGIHLVSFIWCLLTRTGRCDLKSDKLYSLFQRLTSGPKFWPYSYTKSFFTILNKQLCLWCSWNSITLCSYYWWCFIPSINHAVTVPSISNDSIYYYGKDNSQSRRNLFIYFIAKKKQVYCKDDQNYVIF